MAGTTYVGSLVGLKFGSGAIRACYSTVSITGGSTVIAGGLIGYTSSGTKIIASYATGDVMANGR